MDKTTRILLLYSKLIRGEPINKISFCMETDINGRTFDRDIEDIRLYLSELFQVEELRYDRERNNYYLSGVQRQEMEITEYQFLEHLLIESRILRKDELTGIMIRLASNTKNIRQYMQRRIEELNQYEEKQEVALLKMHGDLQVMIDNEVVIRINYLLTKERQEQIVIIPCNLEYDEEIVYLAAYNVDDKCSVLHFYEVEKIESFTIKRGQTLQEKQSVKSYIEHRKAVQNRSDEEEVDIYVECSEKGFARLQKYFENVELKQRLSSGKISGVVHCSANAFVEWVIGQPIVDIGIIEPQNIKDIIRTQINEKMLINGTEENNG